MTRRISVDLPPPVLRVTLPLPPARLSANRTGSSRVARAREVYAYRTDAGWKFAGAGTVRVRLDSAAVRALFFYPTNRRRDPDNALSSLKPAWDGMQDAGIIENDSSLTHLPAVLGIDKENPRVELEVFDVEILFEVSGHPWEPR